LPPPTTAGVPQQKFNWPLKGPVVRPFSSAAEAGAGRGIEIAAQPGTAVLAAEAGRVIYSGDGVSGYGHLVILQHDNQLFTVYGFNQRNLVNQGAFVSRGERIALSGTPPAGGEPRLHFEVRSGKEPVNPQLYLP
jgi:lipoprotein NlpD